MQFDSFRSRPLLSSPLIKKPLAIARALATLALMVVALPFLLMFAAVSYLLFRRFGKAYLSRLQRHSAQPMNSAEPYTQGRTFEHNP